ncbi:MAG TPA: helix-turn-helix domain-containing protein [Candidatus Limnocylindrales bacterium]|jgi:DNA-binding transcriptional ArsR family regulator|nr:helix-turn-helix domain-containing protein [Candidatus Limnocylindrales bacterium]
MIERRPATRAEARALAHPLRLRILRLCLDEALTNRQLADRLDEQPATVLYHVRTLVRSGFLSPQAERRGRRGAREIPYRSTRKSWTLSFEPDSAANLAILDAVRAEIAEAGPEGVLELTRMGVRMRPDQLEALKERVLELVGAISEDDDPDGEPIGILLAIHRRR